MPGVEGRDAGSGEVEEGPLTEDRLVTLDLVQVERVVPMAEHIRILTGTAVTLPTLQRQVPAIGSGSRNLGFREQFHRLLLRGFHIRPALDLTIFTFGRCRSGRLFG